MNHPRTIRIALILVALAAFGCRSLSPVQLTERAPIDAQPVAFESGEQRITDHVVIVTDASGTQYQNQTFPSAKALTQSFVSAMPTKDAPAKNPSTYNAGSIGFGGQDRNIAQLAAFDRGALAGQARSLDVMGSVDGMGGTTPLQDVIAEATASLEGKRGRAALVIFSDGMPDDNAAALASAEALVAAYPDEVCIHTVQTGNTAEGRSFLQTLSGLTSCGSVRNEADLTSGFEVQQLARNVFVGKGTAPVAASPCDGIVRLRGIQFDFDKANIKSESYPVLDVAADQLSNCPGIKIEIGGHTDAIGSDGYNAGLSQRRADATKGYFVQKGVDPSRLSTQGFGESKPVAGNDSADGRAQNRRVELSPIR